jgi:hypothetical protein
LIIRLDSFRFVPRTAAVGYATGRAVTNQDPIRRPNSSGQGSGGISGILVVGPAFAALGRRLPRVVRVPELALGQIIEALLLGANDLELVRQFRGIKLCDIHLSGLGRLPRDIRRSAPTKQAPQEAHFVLPIKADDEL